MKVTIIKNVVETGSHRGRKGETVDVPEDIAKLWIDIMAALPAKAEKPAKP